MRSSLSLCLALATLVVYANATDCPSQTLNLGSEGTYGTVEGVPVSVSADAVGDAYFTVNCADGYTTTTAGTIQCLSATGLFATTYTITPVCAIITDFCPMPTDAGYDFTGITRKRNDTFTPTCLNGYTAGTIGAITCTGTGTTSGSGSFDAATGCTLSTDYCPLPTAVEYDFSSCNRSMTAWCQPTCANGYTGTAEMIQCTGTGASGTFNATTGCTLSTSYCPAPTAQTGYSFTPCANHSMNAWCQPTCSTGYTGTAAMIQCTGSGATGTFNATTGNCAIDNAWCPAPTQTGYVFSCPANKPYNSQCTVTCATDYTGTPAAVTCQAGKTFETAVGCTPSKTGAASSITSVLALIMSVVYLMIHILA